MRTSLTKWFISAMVLTVIAGLIAPSANCGLTPRFVALADDPNQPQPEALPSSSEPVLLEEEGDGEEPQPEFTPFESGRTYLEAEPNEPEPEFSPWLDSPVLLDTDPNAPQPESHRC